ncbi:MAG: hypothetical protein OEN01_04575 [Candidatus Krumholzibacteria bacterium]|nr:hypothetical protein [Candidatus Krumholzibacteria bacterium]
MVWLEREKYLMVTGIVVTHGKLAEELLHTAGMIYGAFDHCHALSNASKSPQVLAQEIESLIDAVGGSSCIIFVDFIGSSCTHACLKTVGDRPLMQVITGVNLPMILAFLNKRDEVPFDELMAAIVQRSFDSIRVLDSTNS